MASTSTTRRPASSKSDSTADIACWFIDTAYDDQQFFVRHAYFIGADDPYDRLKRALRADIDEAAWASLNSTVSRPFARPDSGRIAVKVINHYGRDPEGVWGLRRATVSGRAPRYRVPLLGKHDGSIVLVRWTATALAQFSVG